MQTIISMINKIMDEPLVSICCITYNHEKFIKDAIEGFLMQKTDFPFEILVHDDASTDETPDILREYQEKHPDLFRIVFQTENRYSRGLKNTPLLYNMARGKYIALCEGDDYWTDPLKLQKQVDFLEAHPECSLCCHRVLYKYEDAEEKNYLFPDFEENKIFEKQEFYGKYFSATCSVVFRNFQVSDLIKFMQGFLVGDLPLYYFYMQLGNFGYLSEAMGVYRMHDLSLWFPRSVYQKNLGLFDTYLKIRSRLKIRGSSKLDKMILSFGLKTLNVEYQNKNYRGMRKTLRRTTSILFSADRRQKREYFKYCLLAHFPGLTNLYHSLKTEKNRHESV